MNISFYAACVTQAGLILYFIVLVVFLRKNLSDLDKKEFRQRVGSAYTKFNVKRTRKEAIAVLSCIKARNLCLSVAITFGTGHLPFQLFFLNFSSMIILTLMGTLRPFETRIVLWHEIFNEFSIRLLLFSLLVCQTDFIDNVGAKSTMGWVFIGIIVFNVIVNFGLVLFAIGQLFKLRIRRCQIKRKIKSQQSLKAQQAK